jgi:hypothetical protein
VPAVRATGDHWSRASIGETSCRIQMDMQPLRAPVATVGDLSDALPPLMIAGAVTPSPAIGSGGHDEWTQGEAGA